MTVLNPSLSSRPRPFPSRLVLVAAGELIFIACMLRWADSPAMFAGAVAASLVAIQLGAVLLRRFARDTRKVRKAAEAAEVSSQAVMITDPSGRVKWTNARFTDLTGFTLTESAGKTFSMLLHGQFTDTHTVEFIRHEMRRERGFSVEILQYTKTGKQIYVQSEGEPCSDAGGRITHYVITQTDLTDQQMQTREIDQLADALNNGLVMEAQTPEPAVLEADYPENDPALRLAQQLEQLSSDDDRQHLQELVDGLKTRIEDCVASLPAPEVQTADEATEQTVEGQKGDRDSFASGV
jgi:PAS domain S-box-containing protein